MQNSYESVVCLTIDRSRDLLDMLFASVLNPLLRLVKECNNDQLHQLYGMDTNPTDLQLCYVTFSQENENEMTSKPSLNIMHTNIHNENCRVSLKATCLIICITSVFKIMLIMFPSIIPICQCFWFMLYVYNRPLRNCHKQRKNYLPICISSTRCNEHQIERYSYKDSIDDIRYSSFLHNWIKYGQESKDTCTRDAREFVKCSSTDTSDGSNCDNVSKLNAHHKKDEFYRKRRTLNEHCEFNSEDGIEEIRQLTSLPSSERIYAGRGGFVYMLQELETDSNHGDTISEHNESIKQGHSTASAAVQEGAEATVSECQGAVAADVKDSGQPRGQGLLSHENTKDQASGNGFLDNGKATEQASGNEVSGNENGNEQDNGHAPLHAVLEEMATGAVTPPQVSMKYELLRLCTLRKYPDKTSKPFLTAFAKAGFYYAGSGDELCCYACGLKRSKWTANEDPMEIHKILSPACPFLTNNSAANCPVPEISEQQRDRFKVLDAIPEPRGYGQRKNETNGANGLILRGGRSTVQQSDALSNTRDRTSANQNGRSCQPKYPQYALRSVRLRTYVDWPNRPGLTKEDMTDCGFFYAGFVDCVRCFSCGAGLRSWDVGDNPWIEHSRFADKCDFLETNSDKVAAALANSTIETQAYAVGGAVSGHGAQNMAVCTALTREQPNLKPFRGSQSTFSTETAANRSNQSDNYNKSSSGGANSSILKDKQNNTFDKSSGSKTLKNNNTTTQNSLTGECVMKSKHSTASEGLPRKWTNNKSKGLSAAQRLRVENEKLKSQSICHVCKVKENVIVYLPCAHLVSCITCAAKEKYCGICGQFIKGTVRTYSS